jgi:hypothetical protein
LYTLVRKDVRKYIMESKLLYDDRHGGPYDRGGADSYYGRGFRPHYFVGDTYRSDVVELEDMTPEEITAYSAGYRDNEDDGNFKDWG